MKEKTLDLLLHCGGNEVTAETVRGVDTPKPTDTWCPIPHHKLIERVLSTLTDAGLRTVHEVHGLSHEGARYFGMFQVANGDQADDYGLVVGLRNSHDKSFPAAICLGAGVFVCDNLSFSGEIKLARRHTRYINRDLPGLVARGVGRLIDHRQLQDRRIEAYKGHSLTDVQAHDVLVNAMDCRAIGPCKLPHVLKEWREPQHEEFQPRNVWSLFNSFTETMKGTKPDAILRRTQVLHGLMDSVCGLATAS